MGWARRRLRQRPLLPSVPLLRDNACRACARSSYAAGTGLPPWLTWTAAPPAPRRLKRSQRPETSCSIWRQQPNRLWVSSPAYSSASASNTVRQAGGPGWRGRPKLVALMASVRACTGFRARGASESRHPTVEDYARPPVAGQAPIQVASLLSGRHAVGEAFVYAGNPTWLFMYMDDVRTGRARSAVRSSSTRADHLAWPILAVGWQRRMGGEPSQPAGRLIEARVVDASGKVLASADLS